MVVVLKQRKFFVVVQASEPNAYPRVALASARILSGSVVRTLWGGEGLPKLFCLVTWGIFAASIQ